MLAPHIAEIANAVMLLPLDLRSDPYVVPFEYWTHAKAEMHNLMRDRGWPMVPSTEIGRPNFLLMGTPICPDETMQ